jgi:hypothetical protein
LASFGGHVAEQREKFGPWGVLHHLAVDDHSLWHLTLGASDFPIVGAALQKQALLTQKR